MVDLRTKTYPSLTSFGGINTGVAPFNVGEGESTDEKNISSDNYPSITQRKEAEELAGSDVFEEICYLGNLFDGSLFCIGKKIEESERWIYKYDGSQWIEFIDEEAGQQISGALSSISPGQLKAALGIAKMFCTTTFCGQKTVIVTGEICGDSCMYTISNKINEEGDTIYVATAYWWKDYTEEIENNLIPRRAAFVKEKDSRLLSVGKRDTNFCISEYQMIRYRQADDFTIYDVVTEAGDYGTGLAVYNDTAIYFKRNSTYILYGKTPDSYYFDVLSRSVGCISHKSIAEVNAGLLWLGADGVYAYSATTRPYKISQNVQRYIDNMAEGESACGVSDGTKYYLSLKQKSGEYVLLVFDTEKQVWHVWDNPGYLNFLFCGGEIYGATTDRIYKLGKKENSGEWYFITKPFDVGGASRGSNIYKLFLNVYAKAGSRLEVHISGDAQGDNFKCLYRKSFGSDKFEKCEVRIAPCKEVRDLKYFRLKFSGVGECEIYGVEVYMRVKGRSY